MSDGTIFPSPTGGLPLSDGGPHLDPIYSEIDPGPVGAGRRWVILSTGAYSIRNDANTAWVSVGGTGTVPAFAAVGTIAAEAIGSTASAGVATSVPRGDHRHAMPASGAPVAEALGSTQVTGAAGTFADSAHRHAMPAKSVAIPLVESGSGSAGTSANPSLDDHVHPAAAGGGGEIDYVQKTSNTNIPTGAATTILTSASVAYAAGNYIVEFGCDYLEMGVGAVDTILELFLDGTSVGIIALVTMGNGQRVPINASYMARGLSAASHVWAVKGSITAVGTSVIGAGTGGAGGHTACYIRVSAA